MLDLTLKPLVACGLTTNLIWPHSQIFIFIIHAFLSQMKKRHEEVLQLKQYSKVLPFDNGC